MKIQRRSFYFLRSIKLPTKNEINAKTTTKTKGPYQGICSSIYFLSSNKLTLDTQATGERAQLEWLIKPELGLGPTCL